MQYKEKKDPVVGLQEILWLVDELTDHGASEEYVEGIEHIRKTADALLQAELDECVTEALQTEGTPVNPGESRYAN